MKKINVGIVNYGMGNIKSIENSLLYLGCRFKVLSNPDKISSYSHLILPGVGSFKKAIENLKINGLHQAIQECANNKGINLLGICLGMQLLCESSSEGGFTKGLSLIKNKVETFTQKEIGNKKIPHVGFNQVKIEKDSSLFKNINDNSDFYFDHSFRVIQNKNLKNFQTCEYGTKFVASFEKDNIYGTQFHPEKSQSNGLTLMYNFLNN
ncbi:imidazole glycerol phosphate synthase subunit HisH [Candidatus Pelagibacter sp.]|jgi:glutamine amidotransferase|nr:imidazole glycerol phosphate synthase subunit HisH [Candidatus Pelagibacter sp.]|tara:strand:+ start:150 stop:776 length:627 start_codon:yes stop_codon:yes gene_type:complete